MSAQCRMMVSTEFITCSLRQPGRSTMLKRAGRKSFVHTTIGWLCKLLFFKPVVGSEICCIRNSGSYIYSIHSSAVSISACAAHSPVHLLVGCTSSANHRGSSDFRKPWQLKRLTTTGGAGFNGPCDPGDMPSERTTCNMFLAAGHRGLHGSGHGLPRGPGLGRKTLYPSGPSECP